MKIEQSFSRQLISTFSKKSMTKPFGIVGEEKKFKQSWQSDVIGRGEEERVSQREQAI